MKNLKAILAATLVMILLLGFLALSTFDYDVSMNLINPHSSFAEFFNRWGETPALLGLLVGTAILFGARKKEKKLLNLIVMAINIPLLLFFSYFTVFMPFNYAYEHIEGGIPSNQKVLIYVISVLLFTLTLYLIRKIGQEKLRAVKKAGIVLIVLVILEVVLVNVTKIIWARPRMRSIESIEQFKYWFEINGPSGDNELKSFPSGHTANGFVMLAYSMFIPINRKKTLAYFTGFALTWGTLVALSRVILGAHFLSDVFVGGYITVISFYVLNSLINKRKNEEVIKNNSKRAVI